MDHDSGTFHRSSNLMKIKTNTRSKNEKAITDVLILGNI
jgi:hypothetical protein